MSIPFDNLDVDQRDEVLSKMQTGISAIREEYRLSSGALTEAERSARLARANAGRLAMMQQLDQLGLIGWYQEQNA
jgi:hypothetical protein